MFEIVIKESNISNLIYKISEIYSGNNNLIEYEVFVESYARAEI